MEIGVIVGSVTGGFAALLGLVYLIMRNVRKDSAKEVSGDVLLKQQVKTVCETVTDPQRGLHAVSDQVGALEKSFIKLEVGHDERLKAVERDVGRVNSALVDAGAKHLLKKGGDKG